MAPAYKLIYFEGRGAAEVARYLFKYGGIEFDDTRIKQADWPQVKESTPFGQLPLLEFKGKKINQSIAIFRYLGKLVKLAGKDDWENLEIDAVADTINDLRHKLTPIFYEKDEEKKNKLKETATNETIPYYLSRLDAIVAKNKGYLALGRLTWVDFFFTCTSSVFVMVTGVDSVAKYANLKALGDNVNALPAIKKWIEERPKTEF